MARAIEARTVEMVGQVGDDLVTQLFELILDDGQMGE